MRASLLLVLLITVASPLTGCGQNLGWSVLKQQIRAAYPDVQQLSTDSLSTWLATEDRPVPVLLDVRTEPEFAVSHLPDARRLDPETSDFAALDTLPRDTPLVTYCSVGYRSSDMAERLQAAGFTNVMNLEGSIFAWANESRPVYRDGESVQQVHPYDAVWGKLLDKELRTYEPAPEQ
ncbi:MAG TPA: rhodanese-like domain-containing protein [Rhodothermales bacterium]|nr:rhodanese-like domain-containing protein [Rhodothermales bacterium]